MGCIRLDFLLVDVELIFQYFKHDYSTKAQINPKTLSVMSVRTMENRFNQKRETKNLFGLSLLLIIILLKTNLLPLEILLWFSFFQSFRDIEKKIASFPVSGAFKNPLLPVPGCSNRKANNMRLLAALWQIFQRALAAPPKNGLLLAFFL